MRSKEVKPVDEEKEAFASRLSYEVVQDVAPEELPLFEDIREEFLKNPDAFSEKDPGKREKMLGFGGEALGPLITTVVLPLIWSVVSYIGMAGIGSFKETMAKKVEKKVKETIEGGEKPLSREKTGELKEYVMKNAVTLGLNEAQAALIADSVIGKLKEMGDQ